MGRRLRGGSTLAAVLTAIAAACAGCGGGDPAEPVRTTPTRPAERFDRNAPNIVVIETDDQAIDTMRAMPRTRRLLGREGTTFVNSIASYPLCCPSRATFLTGEYAHNHGVLSNRPPEGGYGRLDNRHTLPVWLQRAGYRTALVGKYLNGYGEDAYGGPLQIPAGYSDWVAVLPEGKTSGYDYELNINGELVERGDEPSDYKTDVLAAEASALIDDAAPAPRPFFLYIPTDAPHTDPGIGSDAERNPVPAPRHLGDFEGHEPPTTPSYDERDVSDKPREISRLEPLGDLQEQRIEKIYVSQLESLEAVDELVASVVARLRRAGELDRTLVVYTSDNGFIRGQHRIDEGKGNIYEEALRVPLLVRGPGFPAGVRARQLVANVDLAPTILRLASARRRADVPLDGVPLMAAARGRAARDAVLVEIHRNKGPSVVGVRTQRYLYARRGDRPGELYDLRRDPYELENRFGDRAYRPVRTQLERQARRLADCAGAECR